MHKCVKIIAKWKDITIDLNEKPLLLCIDLGRVVRPNPNNLKSIKIFHLATIGTTC